MILSRSIPAFRRCELRMAAETCAAKASKTGLDSSRNPNLAARAAKSIPIRLPPAARGAAASDPILSPPAEEFSRGKLLGTLLRIAEPAAMGYLASSHPESPVPGMPSPSRFVPLDAAMCEDPFPSSISTQAVSAPVSFRQSFAAREQISGSCVDSRSTDPIS